MYRADSAAIMSGIAGERLMDAAGWQVARHLANAFRPRPVLVLCGPGNNGGDGFVAARYLASWGWPVRVALLGDPRQLKGDAAGAAKRWRGAIENAAPALLDGAPLILDALFGAGLARPIDGMARDIIDAIRERDLDVVSVDVPSGVSGDTGEVRGAAPRARLTISFFRPKPGHLLMPGRMLCGRLVVADIGIPGDVLGPIAPATFANDPALWAGHFPRPNPLGNKYNRGHCLVAGGGTMTGAARLGASAARRIGAGLVTIVAPEESLAVYRAGPPGAIVQPDTAWSDLLADARKNALLIGPGLGPGAATRTRVLEGIAAGKIMVIDADALTSFADAPDMLWREIKRPGAPPAILTPHDGEYARLFKYQGNRLDRARAAAAESGAIIVLKGPDCVVASPDGRAAIASNAPPDLATAGSGDVLAGLIAGLLAQGMDPFAAASAGVWLHGAAADCFGSGLIAEDIIDTIPEMLRDLHGTKHDG
jgi:NAD(P)H-hydrate epimerase